MAFEDDRFLTARSTDDTIGADYDRVIQSFEKVIYTFLGAPVGVAFTPIFAVDQDGNVQIQEDLTFKNSSDVPVNEILDEITDTSDEALATVTAIKNYVDSGSMSFRELTDVDINFDYDAHVFWPTAKFIKINTAGTALIQDEISWADLASSGTPLPSPSTAYQFFVTNASNQFAWRYPEIYRLGDVPDYNGLPGTVLTVNGTGDGLQWSTPAPGGVTDHGLLSGRDDDDHKHYVLNTDDTIFGTLSHPNAPSAGQHVANKTYVDTYARSYAAVSGTGSVPGSGVWTYIDVSGSSSPDIGVSGGAVTVGSGTYLITVQCRFAGGWTPVGNPYGAIGAGSSPGTNTAIYRWAVDGSGEFKQNTATYAGSATGPTTIYARAMLNTVSGLDSSTVTANMNVVRIY